MSSEFGTLFNKKVQEDGNAAYKLSRVVVGDLKRSTSLRTFKQLSSVAVNITSVTESGCFEIVLLRKAVQPLAANIDGACDLLEVIAGELHEFMMSKRVQIDSATSAFTIVEYIAPTIEAAVANTTATTRAETMRPELVASSDEAAMSGGTVALVAILIIVVFGIFYWGYNRYFKNLPKSEDGAEKIALGDRVESRTVSTKDSVSALPIVMNSVFETNLDNPPPVVQDADDFGVTAIALSHRQSAFSLEGGAGEHANRRSVADWGFEPDIDVDMPKILVHIDGIPTADMDDSLPGELPGSSAPGSPKKGEDRAKREGHGKGQGNGKRKGNGKGNKVKVAIATPLGLSFKKMENGKFVVTKVKPESNSAATGQIAEGMQIVSVNGTALKGLEKADVATLIKASGAECVLELRSLSSASGTANGAGGAGGGPSAGAGAAADPPSFDASQAEDAKKGATGDANHSQFRHSVLDEVLKGGDEVLAVQMGGSPKKAEKDKKKKSKKGGGGGKNVVTIPSPLGFSFKQDMHGYLVTKVKEGGNAEASGQVQADMRIISINGSPVAGNDKPTVTNMIKSASAAEGKVTVEFAPSIVGASGGPPAPLAMPSAAASPKKGKKEKKSSKKGNAAWNAMELSKEDALAKIRGGKPGSFVMRATDKAAAALSVIKPDGKMYNRLIDRTASGLCLKASSQTFPGLEAIAEYYAAPAHAQEGGLPCPLLLK